MSSAEAHPTAPPSESAQESRGRRALERQLDYQEDKAAKIADHEDDIVRQTFLRSQFVRQKLEKVRPLAQDARILEVGSGAHGLAFGLGVQHAFGIDPLALHYKRLFPKVQRSAVTAAAIGEQLPFADGAFDVVLSDNVIDHATRPLDVVDEIVRVAKPGGLIYFTVNVHHPLYDLASRAHGAWNAVGIKLELSAFADHTVHLTEAQIAAKFASLPIRIIEQSSTIAQTRAAQRARPITTPDHLLKRFFFKNALFELLAQKP
jgi:SAM-dependent methyltransferase